MFHDSFHIFHVFLSLLSFLQLAMINIHCKLAELSQQQQQITLAANNTTTSASNNINNSTSDTLHFRRPKSNPGGGLYRHLDDVRPVLQVSVIKNVMLMCGWV